MSERPVAETRCCAGSLVFFGGHLRDGGGGAVGFVGVGTSVVSVRIGCHVDRMLGAVKSRFLFGEREREDD